MVVVDASPIITDLDAGETRKAYPAGGLDHSFARRPCGKERPWVLLSCLTFLWRQKAIEPGNIDWTHAFHVQTNHPGFSDHACHEATTV